MPSTTLYTAREAAGRLDIASSRVRQLAPVLGVGRKVGSYWIFTDADIEQMRLRNTQQGRPRLVAAAP